MPIDLAARVLLYVEDEALIQTMLVMALEDAGFLVLAAASGDQALAVLASSSQSLDGLITDVNLGKGPDGWDVACAARELVVGLPVVYVSAESEGEWASRGVSGSLMISKPFASGPVVTAISSLLVLPG